jgi:nucleotide-binding universal stress UspA family protein
MKLLEKILVAVDFAQPSRDVLRMATLLAKSFHSEIILIHVIPIIAGLKIDKGKVRRIETQKLIEIEIDLKKKGISSVETIVRFGIPFERIIEHSEELDSNLIIIGSGEKEKQFLLGTTAERVIIYANKPVLVVKRGAPPLIRRICCPVDFSETSERALKNAIYLSTTFQSHLSILTVFEPLLSSYFGMGQTPGESKEKILVKRQQQQFDKFLRRFNFENLNWNKKILRGRPHQEILRAIHDTKSDLLVMGSTGKTGLKRMIMGSTTEKVVREVPCSLITVKQEHVIRLSLEREVAEIEAHFRRGKELLRKEMTKEALTHFEECIRRDPHFVHAWEAMAGVYQHMGQGKEAKRCEEMATYIRNHLWENQREENKVKTN